MTFQPCMISRLIHMYISLLALFSKFMILLLFFSKVSHLLCLRCVDIMRCVLLFMDGIQNYFCTAAIYPQKDKQTTNPNRGGNRKENGAPHGNITQDS